MPLQSCDDKQAVPLSRAEAAFAIADLVHALAYHAKAVIGGDYDFYLRRGREILRRLHTAGWSDQEESR